MLRKKLRRKKKLRKENWFSLKLVSVLLLMNICSYQISKCLHLTAVREINKNHSRTPSCHPPTNYSPDTTALWGGATVCAVVCVSASVYACVFVCLCGMAGQRNALAHAWLSRHNGPALSHCREIPLWYRGREWKREGDANAKCLQLSEKYSSIQNCDLCLFVFNLYLLSL